MRRILQIAILIGGFVPVGAGLAGMILSISSLDLSFFNIDLDNHYRYLSGLLFGIGLAFWSTIPSIEHKGDRFQLLTAIVFVGGLARLGGIVGHGLPSAPMIFGLMMELIVTPLLCILQSRVAQKTFKNM